MAFHNICLGMAKAILFGLVELVLPEVDGPELLFRLFVNSQQRLTSESLGWENCSPGKEPGVGLPLHDPHSCDEKPKRGLGLNLGIMV